MLVPQLAVTARDAACLFLLTVLTAVPYVSKLGFYSDDWVKLADFHSDILQHRFGLASALAGYEDRPLQGIYLATLFKLFGFQPLFHHLVNTAVIAEAISLFYWLLVRMNFGRTRALAAALLLIVLPQLSTIRVWYAAFEISLSMVAALASIHCQLSFVRTSRWPWAVAAAIAALASIGLYEIFAPLIAAFAIMLAAADRRQSKRGAVIMAAAVTLIGAAAAAAKAMLSGRAVSPDAHVYVKGLMQLVRTDYDWRTDYSLNIFAALDVHFWWPVLGWWRAIAALAKGQLGWSATAVAIAMTIAAFLLLRSQGSPDEPKGTDRRLLLLGVGIFILGHAVFLVAPAIFFSPAGISNRTLVAAAPGVAMIFAVAVGYLFRSFGDARRAEAYAATIALAVFGGSLRIEQIASYWADVPPLQRHVIEAARSDLSHVPAQSMVMLDNVCPYHGPAVVFESPWDVSGALELALGRPIHGDTVSARMSVRPNGLATSIYGEAAFYPFGERLYIYDPVRHRVAQITDLRAARDYFRASADGHVECPRGYVGHGVLI